MMTAQKPKNEKTIEEITRILQERSTKSFEIANKIILSEKRECKELNVAFEYYAKNRIDYIHVGLISIACEAVNGNPDDSIPIQVVMLLLTAAIDIHDDIIDGSKTKYGRPTLFGKFGKDVALLVGDAFLIEGLTFLHKLEGQFSSQKINAIWGIINNLLFEMGDAEALEVSSKRNIGISPEEYLHILKKKAANLEMYMRIGAIIGDARQSEIEQLGNYGRILGTLTGIREDFVDIFEPDELQNRMKNELLPLPILHAFKNPKTKETITDILSKTKISDKDAERIVEIIYEEKAVEIFKSGLQRLVKKALKGISRLRNPNIRSTMQILVREVIKDL